MEKQINIDLGVCKTDDFSKSYVGLSSSIMEQGSFQSSRNGDTFELLNFKTQLTNPIKRCVGGGKRKPNIFFLLAESLWIWSGRKDVAFLQTFNSQMKNFSDDGKNFHAPYGFRLRNYGVSSFDVPTEENMHALQGIDQIEDSILMLANNPQDRRVVCSIWDANLDLNVKSLDLPCNDMLMFKVRIQEGVINPDEMFNVLHLTIQNRSNDLHWGLTTNIFQFSWILETTSKILNIGVGTQTHNSQSLHAYFDNPLTNHMSSLDNSTPTIYDFVEPSEMDFKLPSSDVSQRLRFVDSMVNEVLASVENIIKKDSFALDGDCLIDFDKSKFLHCVSRILRVFTVYKKQKDFSEAKKISALNWLLYDFTLLEGLCSDFYLLAMNWFAADLTVDQRYSVFGNKPVFGKLDNSQIGNF